MKITINEVVEGPEDLVASDFRIGQFAVTMGTQHPGGSRLAFTAPEEDTGEIVWWFVNPGALTDGRADLTWWAVLPQGRLIHADNIELVWNGRYGR